MKPEWTAPVKDPADSLRHSVNAASQFLRPGETITAFTVTPPSGLTIANPAQDNGIISWTVAGGQSGASYDVVIRFTTSLPRTIERTIRYIVNER